jgi:amino acid permease
MCDLNMFQSIRFRRAWKVQGHSIDELPYRALGGVYGSWLGVILIVLVAIAQFYIVSISTLHSATSFNHFRSLGYRTCRWC